MGRSVAEGVGGSRPPTTESGRVREDATRDCEPGLDTLKPEREAALQPPRAPAALGRRGREVEDAVVVANTQRSLIGTPRFADGSRQVVPELCPIRAEGV